MVTFLLALCGSSALGFGVLATRAWRRAKRRRAVARLAARRRLERLLLERLARHELRTYDVRCLAVEETRHTGPVTLHCN